MWINAELLPTWAPADAKYPIYSVPCTIVRSLSPQRVGSPKQPLSHDEVKQEDNFRTACNGYVGICGGSFVPLKFPSFYSKPENDRNAETRPRSKDLNYDEPEVDDCKKFLEAVFSDPNHNDVTDSPNVQRNEEAVSEYLAFVRGQTESRSRTIWQSKLNRLAYAGKLLCGAEFTSQLDLLKEIWSRSRIGPIHTFHRGSLVGYLCVSSRKSAERDFCERLYEFFHEFELESLTTWDIPNPVSGGWAKVNDHACEGLGNVPALVWPRYLGPPTQEAIDDWKTTSFENVQLSDDGCSESKRDPDRTTLSGLRDDIRNEFVTILQMRLFDLAIQQRYGQRFTVDETLAAFESHFQLSAERLKKLRDKYVQCTPSLKRSPGRRSKRNSGGGR